MPQALLPDINYIIQGVITNLNQSIGFKDRLSTTSNLQSLNQLLPPEFQVIFNDSGYEKEIQEVIVIKCECKFEIDVTDLSPKISNSQTGYYDSILGITTDSRYIQCPDCQTKIPINAQTDYIIRKADVNDYKAKFVPSEPPPEGLISDSVNQVKYWKWVYLVRKILFTKLRMYRESYRSNHDNQV